MGCIDLEQIYALTILFMKAIETITNSIILVNNIELYIFTKLRPSS